MTLDDGTAITYTVKNGEKGDKGDNVYTWVKYASQEPTEASHSMGDVPDAWRGEYNGPLAEAPTDWKQYKWYKIKGEQGKTGEKAILLSTEIVYQSSDSGTIIPSGAWSTSIPVVAQGKYLWKRTTRKFNTGEPEVSYDVNRMGMDGSGSVSSVAGVSPDSDGNVTLTAADVGALPTTGGDLTGELKMNGQPISGLNEPTEGTQAAPKSYVDKRVPLDGSQAMTGNLVMGGNRVTGLAEPEDGGDAATKGYADTKASLPKTASGTVIALDDASSGPLQGLRIYGRTTQDRTPTPDNPVELVSVGDGGSVVVTIAGKNLYDASLYPLVDGMEISSSDGTVYATSTTRWCATEKYIPVSKSLIGKSIVKSDSATLCFYDNNKIFLRSFSTGTYPFIVPENSAYYRFDMLVENKNTAQIALASTQTDYEPYTAQTIPISTPNGLPGIPVTSGGNYTDADGQQWICDEKDYSRGIYVKRVTKVMFDGSGNIVLNRNTQYPSTNVRFDLVRKDVLNIAKQSGTSYQTILSNYSVAAGNANSTGVWINNEHDYFEGRISMPSSIASTVEEFSELLVNTPIVFIVQLATPIETPIPEDELAAYAALHTNAPNTTVYNDAGAHMDVGYYPPDATMRQEDIKGALEHVGNAAKAYVDAKHFLATVSLPAASWAGDAAPYTQTVAVSGILATDFPHITPVYSSTLATALAQKEAWSMVNQGVPGAGEITFTCFDDKPATEIPIQIEVMR